ncbi:retrovirus-related pol polyprotein from transposon TNT 1-94 [Tanacetum coccineum]
MSETTERQEPKKPFVGGSWSDNGEEDDEKAKDETCLMAHAIYEAYNGGIVIFGSNLRGNIIGKGTISNDSLNIENLEHVDNLEFNLLSVGQICDNKCKVIFSEHDSKITKDGKVIGHANMRLIQSLASKELVRNLPKLKFDQHFCDACKIGNQAHASHKAKNIVSTTRCLELLHMDLFCPSIVRSYGGNLYTLVVLDDYSRIINVTFDETPPPSKTSPLVDDDLDEDQAIKVTEKKNLENNIEDETLKVNEIVNIKESKNHSLENVIGNLNQRTFRLVAQCYNQQEGIVYDETYAPIARLESIRISLAYACALGFKLSKMDIKSAFLNGFINEDVYVAQGPRFIDFENLIMFVNSRKLGMVLNKLLKLGTMQLGLWYPKGTDIETVVYADSDHAGDYVDEKQYQKFVQSCRFKKNLLDRLSSCAAVLCYRKRLKATTLHIVVFLAMLYLDITKDSGANHSFLCSTYVVSREERFCRIGRDGFDLAIRISYLGNNLCWWTSYEYSFGLEEEWFSKIESLKKLSISTLVPLSGVLSVQKTYQITKLST